MIIKSTHLKAMKVIAKDVLNIAKFTPDLEYVQLDYDTSSVRCTDWYALCEFTDTVLLDSDKYWEHVTNMQFGFIWIKDTVYVPLGILLGMWDLDKIELRSYLDWEQNIKEFLYLYWSDPLNYVVTDRFKIGKASLDISLDNTAQVMRNENLFGIDWTPKLMYSEWKVKFDKMLKVLWKWDYEIWKEYTRSDWICDWMSYSIVCRTNVIKE